MLFLDVHILLEEFFSEINIPFDCEFLIGQPVDDEVILTEVYKVSPLLNLRTFPFGEWSTARGLTWSTMGLYDRRNSLHGFTVTTGFKKVSNTRTFSNQVFLNIF